MGFALSWTAVRGKSPEEVLAAFELRPTGRTGDAPSRRDPFCWTQAAGGWVVVLARHDARFLDESRRAERFLASLSAGCELVCCFVEEHVMVSRATAWKDGVELWSVLHDAQVAIDHLQADGTPPSSLARNEPAARAAQRNEAEDVDHLFDVPVDLAAEATGFRHDELGPELEVLEPTGHGRKKSLLGRLLGR